MELEGGFLVLYSAMMIERLERNPAIRYKADEYRKLEQYYNNKIQQVHIVGEYARKMMEDYKAALQFVNDYFHLNYSSFLNKYFKGDRQAEIRQTVTPDKFRSFSASFLPPIEDH